VATGEGNMAKGHTFSCQEMARLWHDGIQRETEERELAEGRGKKTKDGTTSPVALSLPPGKEDQVTSARNLIGIRKLQGNGTAR